MLPSVEARWFIFGPLPETLRTWFEQGMLVEADKKTRTDHCPLRRILAIFTMAYAID